MATFLLLLRYPPFSSVSAHLLTSPNMSSEGQVDLLDPSGRVSSSRAAGRRYTAEEKAKALDMVASGMTYREVGETMGVSQGGLSRWVRQKEEEIRTARRMETYNKSLNGNGVTYWATIKRFFGYN